MNNHSTTRLTSLTERVTAIFVERLNLEVPSSDTDLFETGILDSLKFVELLVHLEEEFGRKCSLEELEIANFSTIERIAEFVSGAAPCALSAAEGREVALAAAPAA